MIKSMTAFSRTHAQGDWGTASIEIKSVNHRYLETAIRLPDALRDLEMPMRELFRQQLQRGKVECFVRYNRGDEVETTISLNQELLNQLLDAAQQVAKKIESPKNYNAFDFLRWPGVLKTGENDLEVAQKAILALTSEALIKLNDVRAREGAVMTECILEKLVGLADSIAELKSRTSNIIIEQRNKLVERIAQLKIELTSERLEQEIAIIAQRSDVTEELERLTAHIDETRHLLKKGGAVGRQLDFMMQEFNREANTLGSKSVDIIMTQTAVNLKVLIEQMREQIQNIE